MGSPGEAVVSLLGHSYGTLPARRQHAFIRRPSVYRSDPFIAIGRTRSEGRRRKTSYGNTLSEENQEGDTHINVSGGRKKLSNETHQTKEIRNDTLRKYWNPDSDRYWC